MAAIGSSLARFTVAVCICQEVAVCQYILLLRKPGTGITSLEGVDMLQDLVFEAGCRVDYGSCELR